MKLKRNGTKTTSKPQPKKAVKQAAPATQKANGTNGTPQPVKSAPPAPQTLPPQKTADLRGLFAQLGSELNSILIKRREIIFVLIVCLLARENVLMLGPPGVAKTFIVSLLMQAFSGSLNFFSYLMTKFTSPDEVFGHFSLKGLKEERFERVTEGKLPTAHVAFLDEVYKSSSAALNGMLTMLNERVFYNGGKAVRSNLDCVFAASNETPDDANLNALDDRFKCRIWVDNNTDRADRRQLLRMKLKSNNRPSAVMVRISKEQLEQARDEVQNVTMSVEVEDLILDVLEELEGRESGGFYISNRTVTSVLPFLQASAWMNGRTEIAEPDVKFLRHLIWKEEKDREDCHRIVKKASNPSIFEAESLRDGLKEDFALVKMSGDLTEDEVKQEFTKVRKLNGRIDKALDKDFPRLAKQADVSEMVRELQNMKDQLVNFSDRLLGAA